MRLCFEVDPAECLRRGVQFWGKSNSKGSMPFVKLEVDPKQLRQEERDLIADRLVGVHVLRQKRSEYTPGTAEKALIVAKGPTLADLLEAIREENLQSQKKGQPA